MKYAEVYAKTILTVYTQPAIKKQFEYDTVLKGETVGVATGGYITNTSGRFIQMIRVGVAETLYCIAENTTFNILDAQSNVLEEVQIVAKKVVKNYTPFIIGSVLALLLVYLLTSKPNS